MTASDTHLIGSVMAEREARCSYKIKRDDELASIKQHVNVTTQSH